MTCYWAKTTPEGKPGLSVYDHMVNVGYVARFIAESFPEILQRFNLRASEVGAFAALHDIGKISPGFQRKCEEWLVENNLVKVDRNCVWDTAMESNHGKVSHAAIQTFLLDKGIDRTSAKYLSTVLGAHHGRLTPPNDRGYHSDKAISETNSQIDWDSARKENAELIWRDFAVYRTSFEFDDETPSLWWLAGLTSVADWIGSDERFFSPNHRASDADIAALARNAFATIGFRQVEFVRDLAFHDLFHDADKPEIKWVPNEMQLKTISAVNGPGVYVIEAPMGMGKTEAALWAAYQLLVAGKANGIYFALPTQATSNRMHLRMNNFVQRISTSSNSSRLIHGNSWLKDQRDAIYPVATSSDSASEDARTARDWFASAKRALLAPFGVGTIDQALLGVVAAKHFFVRHFALAGKVVILDEVHSYDLYTGTLIDKLITTLEGLGCTVIVLSATLTGMRRRQISSHPEEVESDVELSYPLITGRREGIPLKPLPALPPESRTVKVNFVTTENAAENAITLARQGGAVLWICNTVDAAQKQYKHFMGLSQKDFLVGLLHSRFPFWRREELEAAWMERLGKNGKTRCGSILVATQVVEQSVDLDADLLITELAPTDMILQRLGRLWRHERRLRPIDAAQLFIIEETKSIEEFRNMAPKAIIKALGSKAKVYAPYILLRSLEVWQAMQPQILIPAQIRQVIETTYEDRENEPVSWQELFNEWFGTDSAKKMMASRNVNLWQVALEDTEGVQTRINEMPAIALVLCRTITNTEAIFMDQSKGILNSDIYQLATAQAIHKNLVKVPKYCFDQIEPCQAFAAYLREEHTIGIALENGEIEVNGLKNGIRLFYSDEMGLVIEKSS